MSVRADVAAALREKASELGELAAGWSSRGPVEPAREAVKECQAILEDAAAEVIAPPRERTRA